MSDSKHTFNEIDLKIVEALEQKGLKIPTGAFSTPNDSTVPPLPEGMKDSILAVQQILHFSETKKCSKILPFEKPSSIHDEAKMYAMVARKGKQLSAESEAKMNAARKEILKKRDNKK